MIIINISVKLCLKIQYEMDCPKDDKKKSSF